MGRRHCFMPRVLRRIIASLREAVASDERMHLSHNSVLASAPHVHQGALIVCMYPVLCDLCGFMRCSLECVCVCVCGSMVMSAICQGY